ncbi:coiled-coil domain-containing protein 47 [Agrilus planipennis]|uniref:PAT complex subunit CCDC47 n=1 Tax=Agrilus planipennis TaxID=224129 RepID=A0A1W4XBB0_AGRPL|nr:coiled-coil domain-containing protein 47 [Agrilus planipennis]
MRKKTGKNSKVFIFEAKPALFTAVLMLIIIQSSAVNYKDVSDNEFAEFEDFDVEEEVIYPEADNVVSKESSQKSSDAFEADDQDDIVVEDDSDFEHFQDTEEFEGFGDGKEEKPGAEPKIIITKVPMHFRANWDSYWLEILMIVGLIVYFLNFATGKSKNTKLANVWLQTHKSLLEENFSLVGDDTNLETRENGGLTKESENVFTLWCSGRVCCEGMLVELKFLKRQDLVAVLANLMRPLMDQIYVRVIMNKEDMDSFIFCVASKKAALHLSKEMADLSDYCPERRPGEKYNLPSSFQVMSEIHEATLAMLDSKVTAVLNKYADMIEYIHFSDQYTGVKQGDDSQNLKLPETQKVLLFGFNLPVKGVSVNEAVERMKPLMTMVFYCIDKVKRYRLSKEGKSKADKNRQRVEELFLKSTHVARAEAAAARREERRRLEKERVLAESDPEKQRRWEEKEQKRQAKKRAPKMKQLKVKAL